MMASEIEAERESAMNWAAYGAGVVIAIVVAAVVLAAIGAVSTKIAGGAVQLVGIGLTLLGVAVVRSWLEKAAEAAAEAKQGLDRWQALQTEHVRRWWARRRARPYVVHLNAATSVGVGGSVTATARRARVDRQTVSDRDWLAFLDDRVESIFELMDQAEQKRSVERDDLDRQLAAQRDDLRAETLAATRQGWELIVAGLGFSAVGTVLGMWS